MRNLRQRLMDMTKTQSEPRPQVLNKDELPNTFFCREVLVPISELGDIQSVTLDDVRACDPYFEGNSWDMNRLLFLDTETTGLNGGAGTIAFEIGVGWFDARGMVIRQYVMRNYAQEAAMLSDIARLFERADTIVTFNGKSFDLPLLESRMVMNRIRLHITNYPHLDLLHAARRVYKLRLGRCSLTALEGAVLGKTRDDDLPGAQVPARYFEYLKTGEFALLEDVLRHNFDDVRSLTELTAVICGAYRKPESISCYEDMLGVGRTLMRTGRTQKARTCFKILGYSTLSPQAHMYLASSYKKSREWGEAVEAWKTMLARGEGGVLPYIELAKYYEHIEKDAPKALMYAKHALSYALNAAPLGSECADTELLMRRIERLQNKVRKQQGGQSL